jgi:hypothetical protein
VSRCAVFVTLAVTLLGASACTEGSEKSTSGDAARQAVEEAYLGYWDVLLGASDPADPDDERLTTVATGPQLKEDVAMLRERARTGQRVTGDYEHDLSVTEVADDTASVEDCLTAGITIAADGVAGSPVPPGPYAVTASLVRRDGRWMISELEPRPTGCQSPSAPPAAVPSGAPSSTETAK